MNTVWIFFFFLSEKKCYDMIHLETTNVIFLGFFFVKVTYII